MESNKPYCYLYKDSPRVGDLYVSTVVELAANKDLNTAVQSVDGNKTTVTYTLVSTLGLPAGIRTPDDEKIAWDGSERIVEVVVDDGNNTHTSELHSNDLD